MSSPTTPAANTTSANKKKEEEAEDCRCCSEIVDVVSCVDVVSSEEQRQQSTQLNVFENSSKRQITAFGGNLTATFEGEAGPKKEQDFPSAHAIESVDSGFISGPQPNIFRDQDDEDDAQQIDCSAAPKDDHPQQPKQSQLEQQEAKNIVLDSGCVDEEEFIDKYDECGEHERFATSSNEEKIEVNEQLQKEQSSATVAYTSSTRDPMILQQNVDGGMAERFCNLSLETDATPLPQQQQPQPQQNFGVAAIGLNNLNSAIPRSAPETNLNSESKESFGNSSHTTTTASGATHKLTPMNAWEQFYQQDEEGDTLLHLSVISAHVDVVAALLRMAPHPCLFNIQNDSAQTPAHLAVLTAQPKILRMLLIAGAEPIIRDRRGNTALHLACMSGDEQCVRALTIPISASEINEAHRQYGHRSNDKTVSYLSCARLPSDFEIWNYGGERCVHLAAEAGHIDVLRILVLHGADINAREGKSGRTPLHIAIQHCNEDLLNFLLDECQTLDLEAATYSDLTAYQFACINNKHVMQQILKKRGADPLTPPDSDYDSDSEAELEDAKFYDRFGDPGYSVGYGGGGNLMKVA